MPESASRIEITKAILPLLLAAHLNKIMKFSHAQDGSKLTIGKWAKQAGVSVSQLGKILRGESSPSYMTLMMLSEALNLHPSQIIPEIHEDLEVIPQLVSKGFSIADAKELFSLSKESRSNILVKLST